MESQKIMAKLDRVLNELDFIKNRMSSYLGDGIALSYLTDETPIYVKANDECSANFINGGYYEEESSRVLYSFVKPDSVLLDIGANLGFFSLKIASRLKGGRVLAFEPNPAMVALFKRSIFLNGHAGKIIPHTLALSDSNRADCIRVMKGQTGGGGFAIIAGPGVDEVACEVKKLDDVVPDRFTCDLVKIDVEGHELSVLKGMHNVLQRSASQIKILFEKLGCNAGQEGELYELLRSYHLELYTVEYPSRLLPATLEDFKAKSGNFLAVRQDQLDGRLNRGFFRIYPSNLNILAPYTPGPDDSVRINGRVASGSVAAHGPYWHLPRGAYRLRIAGQVASRLSITVAERFGYPVTTFSYSPTDRYVDFPIERDLCKFELVIRSLDSSIDIELAHILIETP